MFFYVVNCPNYSQYSRVFTVEKIFPQNVNAWARTKFSDQTRTISTNERYLNPKKTIRLQKKHSNRCIHVLLSKFSNSRYAALT